jgi:hypothetical protein
MTQPQFGEMIDNIAARVADNLSVQLHDGEEIGATYAERDFFYLGTEVAYFELWKADPFNEDRIRVEVKHLLFDPELPSFIESTMTKHIQRWLIELQPSDTAD